MTSKGQINQLAVIGLGGQTQGELIPAALKLSSKCQITAICDINYDFVKQSQKLLAGQESPVEVFQNYEKLFKQVDVGKLKVDGIIACLPHFLYADVTKKALVRGIMVFKEKPFAINLAEAKKISALALKENVQIYTVTKRQFYPSYKKGLVLLREGAIGSPYLYSARHFIPHGNIYEGWRSNSEAAGGGVLIDMGYHLLEVILRYFGDVTQANLHWTNTARPDYSYEVEDTAIIHNWHPIGVQGVFQMAALSGPKEESIEIRGVKGRLVVTKSDVRLYDIFGKEIEKYEFETDGAVATAEALELFLSNNKSVWTQNISHNMKIMRVLDMAYNGRYS
ncbi:MAG: Gfo/Idh/MocA family oxidoreductase [Patescibacteria group bacterium]|nr:Gfo/Idh/MocA family oxidoreductase [Patescibacteria group bacterium]